MRITYIHHSGFLLETEQAVMLFDFAKGTLPPLPAKKPLYVFVSHIHGDHYDRRIFSEVPAAADRAGVSSLTYVLSSDIPARDYKAFGSQSGHGAEGGRSLSVSKRPVVVSLGPHETWQDNTLYVETLRSNDEGVAFVIAAPDGDEDFYGDENLRAAKQIYYAGDLNAWNWDGEEADRELLDIYREELARIDATIFDVAFIPLDPRLEDAYTQGITDFFDRCGCEARCIVPMHCWGKYEIIPQAREKLKDRPYGSCIAVYGKPGEAFDPGNI